MKTEVEKFRDAIESIYESPGYFTEKQRIKMKKLRKEREKIYKELAKLKSELFSEVTFIIQTGFFNIWDDKKPMQDHQKLFVQAKSNIRKKIDAYISKINKQLAEKDMDILLTQRRDEIGKPIKFIDFTSVTERFEKKEVAEQKAKKYLQERLFKTATATTSGVSRLKTKAESDKASDKFIESLTTNYRKKHIDEKKVEKIKEEAQVTETFKAMLSEDLKNQDNQNDLPQILQHIQFYLFAFCICSIPISG